MENNIEISLNSGYIKHKEIFVTPEEANNLPPNEVCLLCTGSQGEPLAALSRIANNSHRQIKLQDDDVVIFSSSAIPGNALSISRIINKLYLQGVKVYTNTSLNDVHTSGHGNKEELKLMLRLIKPKYFMPFHGEYRMLKSHADLAIECGMPKENTFILENGDVLSLRKGVIKKDKSIQSGDIYVDGNRIGEIGNAVMRERKIMSNDGIVVVIANIDTLKKELVVSTNITTRGFVLIQENLDLLKEIEEEANNIINNRLKKNCIFSDIKNDLTNNLSTYIYDKTGRYPIILPIINDVKKVTND